MKSFSRIVKQCIADLSLDNDNTRDFLASFDTYKDALDELVYYALYAHECYEDTYEYVDPFVVPEQY